MKLTLLLLGLLCWSAALGQLVHPAGAPVTTVNWQQTGPVDTLALDVDGDNVPDVSFRGRVVLVYLPGDTPAQQLTFTARPRSNGTQLAADSTLPWAVHQFQAGNAIRHGLRWSPYSSGASTLEVSYYYGSSTTYGYFTNGSSAGYLVVRKLQADNRWRYWWIHLNTRVGTNRLLSVGYFGTSPGSVLALAPGAAAAEAVFPNPSRAGWTVPAGSPGPYSLFDPLGRLVGQGELAGRYPTVIDGQHLPAGLYLLRYRRAGQPVQQRLIRQ